MKVAQVEPAVQIQEAKITGAWIRALIGSFFAIFCLLGFGGWTVVPAIDVMGAKGWKLTPCEVYFDDVNNDPEHKWVDVSYDYKVAGATYSSSQYCFGTGDIGPRDRAEFQALFDQGKLANCYVDPKNPNRAVLYRDFTAEMPYGFILLVIGIVMLPIAFGGIADIRERNRQLRRGRPVAGLGSASRDLATVPLSSESGHPSAVELSSPSAGDLSPSQPTQDMWSVPPDELMASIRSGSPATSYGEPVQALSGSAVALKPNGKITHLKPMFGRWAMFNACSIITPLSCWLLYWTAGLIFGHEFSVLRLLGAIVWIPTALCVLLLPFMWIWTFAALFNRTATVWIQGEKQTGATVDLHWKIHGWGFRPRAIKITLLVDENRPGSESKEATSGLTVLHEGTVFDAPVGSRLTGSARLRLPAGIAPSLNRNGVMRTWKLKFVGSIPLWVNIEDDYVIQVAAPPSETAVLAPNTEPTGVALAPDLPFL